MQTFSLESGGIATSRRWSETPEPAELEGSPERVPTSPPAAKLHAVVPGPFGLVWLGSILPDEGQPGLFNRVFVMTLRRLRPHMRRSRGQGNGVGGLGVGIGNNGR